MSWILLVLGAVAAAYQLLMLLAALRHLGQPDPAPSTEPRAVSILKPVRGLDPNFARAIRSHAEQDYPQYEILFGASDPEDPAILEILQLIADFPQVPIRLVRSSTHAPNRKVGVLADLAREARYPILLVNDSDIEVPRDYLHKVLAPLDDPGVGMVTCLYRAASDRPAGRFEALGVSTDFGPSVLVARLLGVSEFALGSTMAFRARDLEAAGGFEAIAEYLADDYQLSKHIQQLGRRVHLSRVVVETSLPDKTWRDVWAHQVRWARTIRVSRGGGYLGMPITHAGLWGILLLAGGFTQAGLGLLGLRVLVGLFAAWFVLGDRQSFRDFWFIPARDLWAFSIWLAGLWPGPIEWRGRRLRLSPEGKLLE